MPKQVKVILVVIFYYLASLLIRSIDIPHLIRGFDAWTLPYISFILGLIVIFVALYLVKIISKSQKGEGTYVGIWLAIIHILYFILSSNFSFQSVGVYAYVICTSLAAFLLSVLVLDKM